MPSATMRGFLGFIAGAIAVLIFHQGMVEAMHALGLVSFSPYRTTPVPPFGVPVIVSNCFWGGPMGRSVRSRDATLHLADLAVWAAAWRARGGGRMVCRRTAEGHADRRRLGSSEHAAFGGDQRVLGSRCRHHPAIADAAFIDGARTFVTARAVTSPNVPSAAADARGSPPHSPPRPSPARSAARTCRPRSSAPASPDRPSTAHPRYRSP